MRRRLQEIKKENEPAPSPEGAPTPGSREGSGAEGSLPSGSAPDASAAQGHAARTQPPGQPPPAARAESRGTEKAAAAAREAALLRSSIFASLGEAAENLPVHPLPEEPRERRIPFGVSAVLHTLVIVVVFLSRWWFPEAAAPQQPHPLTIALQSLSQPEEPAPQRPPALPPRVTPRAPAETARPPREMLPETPAPAEIRPVPPLPAPTRMGELVPVPQIPVPGTVPPEKHQAGKPGPPEPSAPPPVPQGSVAGTNQTDLGAGTGSGPGAAGEGPSPERGAGEVTPSPSGGIPVPRPGGGASSTRGQQGGGQRKGLNLQLPPSSGAFGDFSFEDTDYDWNTYHRQMYWLILSRWYNRLYVMMPLFERWAFQKRIQSLKGAVLIRFVIERSGTVSSIEVLDPSTMAPLDESATSALKEVILPRLPDDFKKDQEAVTGRFLLDIDDVGAWHREMMDLKAMGKF